MARRRYDDGCALTHALDLTAERWALVIVRELLLGPKRFTDLRAGIPAVSPDVLTQRLRDLAEAGILSRRKLPPPTSVWVYELTEWGAELEPAVIHLARWASRSPAMNHDGPMSADSLALALRGLFDSSAASGLNTTIELRLDGQPFQIDISAGEFRIRRGPAAHPDAEIDTDTAVLSGLLWQGRELAEAAGGPGFRFSGDKGHVETFLRLFPLPAPATR